MATGAVAALPAAADSDASATRSERGERGRGVRGDRAAKRVAGRHGGLRGGRHC